MNKLYIVRHGKTDWNVKKIIQGKADISLNEEGINSAKELAKIINLDDIDICMSSPLKRARETAEIIVGGKKEIIIDEDLIERGFGDYEGKTATDDLIKFLWDYKENTSLNNVESIKDVLLRANKFLEKIKNNYPNKSILIVSHGLFIKALHYNLIGYNENTDFMSFYVKNAILYTYDLK